MYAIEELSKLERSVEEQVDLAVCVYQYMPCNIGEIPSAAGQIKDVLLGVKFGIAAVLPSPEWPQPVDILCKSAASRYYAIAKARFQSLCPRPDRNDAGDDLTAAVRLPIFLFAV